MTDHLIPFPNGFAGVHQFDGGSQYKCAEACMADLVQISYPGRYQDPKKLMHDLYVEYVGADIPSNTNGTQKASVLDFFTKQHMGFIDMPVDNLEHLQSEMQAQNLDGIPQFITVSDESFLKYAKNGQSLHNWADALNHGHHCIARVGFSDSEGYGLYLEPAAGLAFAQPVPILWSDILAAGVMTCIAVFPHGVSQWPPAPTKPAFDATKAELTLAAAMAAAQAVESALANVLQDLAVLKGEI